MKLKSLNLLALILCVCINTNGFSQSNSIKFYFNITFGNSVMHLADSTFKTCDTTNLQVEVLKFYISNIQLFKNKKLVFQEKNSFHLVDANKIKSLQFSVNNDQNVVFDELKFDLGIDSNTNVSGAMGGDLDPTRGMYWTWQSGYINFKLEGTSKLCTTRNTEFIFHLGGYKQPNYCLQNLSFPLKNSNDITLTLDVEQIFKQIDLAKTNHIMSPSMEAVQLSKMVAKAFKIIEK